MSNASSRTSNQDAARDAAAARGALDELERALREATLNVIWRQWRSLGGMTSGRPATSLVDPEALVLTSLVLEPFELRLRDVVPDWAALNSDLLSVQRIRNLAARYPVAVQEQLAAFARIAFEEGKDHRWKPLVAAGGSAPIRRRNKVRAIRVQPTEPAALLLRLRLAFGIGTKADLIGFLLGMEEGAWTSIGEIAAATHYTIAAVRTAIRDLADAHLVEELAGSRAEYRVSPSGWLALLELTELPRWRWWHERFAFVAAFLQWAGEARQRPLTLYSLESRGRELFEAHTTALRWPRLVRQRPPMRAAPEPSTLTAAVHALTTSMEQDA
jgi:hypothetical protein